MKGQLTATALALVLAGPAWAGDEDRAVPRGGGGGGSSSSVGSSHHSGGSSGSSSSYSGSSSSSDSGSSYSAPPLTDAQRRHPRAGTGTGGRYYSNGGYYYSPYYSPYYYNPYYSWGLGFGFGYPAYYPGYYGYAPAPYGGGYSYSGYRVGQLRVMVEPRETRVYVDGYYAGVADDFDGLFQRLNVASGRHEVALKLEGHRTFKVKVYVPLDQTIKLRHRMEPGAGEETSPDVIGQPDAYADAQLGDRDDNRAYGEGPPSGEEGLLRLLVNPDDASVYVDGDFRGTVRQLRELRLSPGRHRVELVRPGFRTIEREVDVRPGADSDLRIDLERS